jgi:hypothetical protein
MGALNQAIQSAPGPVTGVTVLGAGLVLAAASVQAARILLALNGPARLPRRPRRAAQAGEEHREARR